MSLETWKAEFYPVEAAAVDAAGASLHSLRKWRGLRARSLKRHGVRLTRYNVYQCVDDGTRESLVVNSATCALCEHHQYRPVLEVENETPRCNSCPLQQLLGEPCDVSDQPYAYFQFAHDPEPMIAALKKVVARERRKRKSP